MRVSAELLRDLLEFPPDVEIVGDLIGNVPLVIQSDRIPEGCEEVTGVWMKRATGNTLFLRFDPVKLWEPEELKPGELWKPEEPKLGDGSPDAALS